MPWIRLRRDTNGVQPPLTSEQSPPEPGNVPRNWGKALEDWGPSGKFSKLFEQAPSLGKKRRIFTCPIQKKFLEK